uniref:S locus F-box (SLF)-S1E protein n=1 Tax=Antirrhinum hispanicum TaxID=49039 RepID=Q70WR3_ANTHI|nr:S locus F-box (SLF)-S1E protein [Antirrhinum hispanicum]
MIDSLLPLDMVIEIMVQLPVKSLVRFRCVSKSFCVIIKSSNFINNHFLRRQTRDTLLLIRRYFPSPQEDDALSFHKPDSPGLEEEVWAKLSIPFLSDLRLRYDQPYFPQSVIILGPCNGLICIFYDDFIISCNPALREFKKLPPCPFCCPKRFYSNIIGQGFGNCDSNFFKIVLVRTIKSVSDYNRDKPYIMVHLYNSNTQSWRLIEGEAVLVQYIFSSPCTDVFFNGACHWNAGVFGIPYPGSILTFDISTEIFSEFEYPDGFRELYGGCLCLTALSECLSVIRYNDSTKDPQFIEIWVMKVYGNSDSWTKDFVLGPHLVIRPFIFWKNDDWLLVDNSNGQLASCALHTDEIKRFQVDGTEESLRVLIYNESLINLGQVIQLV